MAATPAAITLTWAPRALPFRERFKLCARCQRRILGATLHPGCHRRQAPTTGMDITIVVAAVAVAETSVCARKGCAQVAKPPHNTTDGRWGAAVMTPAQSQTHPTANVGAGVGAHDESAHLGHETVT